MRNQLCLAALAVALAAPHLALGHGTERHYGSPFKKRAAEPPSPAFSMMLIDNSLKAIRRTLEAQAEDDITERLESVQRSTAALLYTTGEAAQMESDFASFASTLETQSPLLLRAISAAAPEQALSAVSALEESFEASKQRYQSRSRDG